jgi:phage-related protein
LLDQEKVFAAIKDVMAGFPVTVTSIKKLRNKIWEIRLSLSVGEVRIIFSPSKGNRLLLVHGFIKKTQKTPLEIIELAEERVNTFR